MNTYIALLRGINVGGHRKIKMADLKGLFDKLGYKDPITYMQSGNVIFRSSVRNRFIIEENIKNGIAETFGFDVPVLVKTKTDLITILEECPYKEPKDLEANKVYYVLLKNAPQKECLANPVSYQS